MLPSLSATRPCGPSLEPLRGYSLNAPVAGSRRPSLLTICSVNHREPSGATAGSCGCAPLVGTSHSRMFTFSAATGGAGSPRREGSPAADASTRIAGVESVMRRSCTSDLRKRHGYWGYRASSRRQSQYAEGDSSRSGALCFHLRHAFLKLPGEMGDDAKLAFDEHELGPVVHFMLFSTEEALEAGLLGLAVGIGDPFREEFGGQGFDPGGELLAFAAEKLENFGFAAGLVFFGIEFFHQSGEVEADECGELFSVHPFPDTG